MDQFRLQEASDPEGAKSAILSVFGGAGSFNDVILYRDGQPLTAENTRLEALRDELYTLCRQR